MYPQSSMSRDLHQDSIQIRRNIGALVEGAVAREDLRDETLVGDIEPGQLLEYPSILPEAVLNPGSPFELQGALADVMKQSDPPPSQMPQPITHKRGRRKRKYDGEESSSLPASVARQGEPSQTQKRRKRRQMIDQRAEQFIPIHTIRPAISAKAQESERMEVPFSVQDLPMAQGCHIGIQQDVKKHAPSLEQLLADGYEIVEWSG
ncbi:hypothetical protein EIP86_000131, partial [Pleurotus ostreatoroseus]